MLTGCTMTVVRILKILMIGLIIYSCSQTTPSTKQVIVLDVLYERHEQWQGTPYVLGGYDQQGIDCSGFVALTYTELFDIQLPRSTQDQAQIDAEIPPAWLQSGDLVFFKIPKQGAMYHVGIYLEDQQFLHASTSRGVMISDLQTDYWAQSFWKAIRVLP